MQDNYFQSLNGINVNDKTEKKNGLTYLSWAWAWGEVKKLFPDATYTIYENADGWFYHTDGKTCWVKTGVTVNGIEHIEFLPVMDFKNKSIPLNAVTSYDVNKAIQRSLTKAVARHGLGLYIYAGEDLPEEEAPQSKPPQKPAAPAPAAPKPEPIPQDMDISAMRNRLNKITFALAKGDRASMSQAYNIWSNGKYNAIDEIPDGEIANVLYLAENIYRKRGYND